MYRSFKNIPRTYIFIIVFLLCAATIVTCLTKSIVLYDEPITDLASLFPEYTEVTGGWAMHDLDQWCRAEPEQTTALLDMLALYATFEPRPIHYTEVHIRDNAGETHFAFDLGEKRCDIYTASYGTEDRLLFDYGSGNLHAYTVDRTSEKYKMWSSKDEKNIFSYQLHLLEENICDSSDTSVHLRDLNGGKEYTHPTKIAAALLRESVKKSLIEEILYTYDEEPKYNLEIIMDNMVYICDDELGVFHIKSKEDTLYYVFPHSHLNYDKYRQDDYKYTPPPAVDMPND